MTLAQLLAPVAAATIVNTLLGGAAWRATQIEKRTGRAPWYLGGGIAVYGLAAAMFVYAYRGAQITTGIEAFAVSLVAEALGVLVIYTLLHAVYRTDVRPSQRIFTVGGSLFLLCGLFGALFY